MNRRNDCGHGSGLSMRLFVFFLVRKGMNRGSDPWFESIYQPYIDGIKEIREINEEFRAPFVRG